jgi:hypothetical protein
LWCAIVASEDSSRLIALLGFHSLSFFDMLLVTSEGSRT